MVRYIANRVFSGLVSLGIFLTMVFVLVDLAVPGDFVTSLGPLSMEQAAQLRRSFGLDRPLAARWLDWMTGLATLDLGESFGGGSVWERVGSAMSSTLVVLTFGVGLAFLLGGWMGRTAGYTRSAWVSLPITLVSILCLTVFPPALGVALEQGMRDRFGLFGWGELGSVDQALWATSPLTTTGFMWRVLAVMLTCAVVLFAAERVFWAMTRRGVARPVFLVAMAGLPWVVWWQMGLSSRVADLAGSLLLLVAAVVVLTFGEVALITRASMDDVLLEDYVLAARAKGLPERWVRDRHAARTALIPVLSRFTVAVPYFLTGLVILEATFAGAGQTGLPQLDPFEQAAAPAGLGSLIFDAASDQDLPLLLGALAVVGVITLGLRIALDVFHAAIDPRLRLGDEPSR